MSYRPFRNIGRLLLAACAVSFGVASVSAQNTLPNAPNPSRVDIFAGYSYFGVHGDIHPTGDANAPYTGPEYAFSSVDIGAMGSGAYYFNRNLGLEIAAMMNPNGHNDHFYGGFAGPIFRAPLQDYTLFAHGLIGGVRGAGPQ